MLWTLLLLNVVLIFSVSAGVEQDENPSKKLSSSPDSCPSDTLPEIPDYYNPLKNDVRPKSPRIISSNAVYAPALGAKTSLEFLQAPSDVRKQLGLRIQKRYPRYYPACLMDPWGLLPKTFPFLHLIYYEMTLSVFLHTHLNSVMKIPLNRIQLQVSWKSTTAAETTSFKWHSIDAYRGKSIQWLFDEFVPEENFIFLQISRITEPKADNAL